MPGQSCFLTWYTAMRLGPTVAGTALWWMIRCRIWRRGRVLYSLVSCLTSSSVRSLMVGLLILADPSAGVSAKDGGRVGCAISSAWSFRVLICSRNDAMSTAWSALPISKAVSTCSRGFSPVGGMVGSIARSTCSSSRMCVFSLAILAREVQASVPTSLSSISPDSSSSRASRWKYWDSLPCSGNSLVMG